MKPPDKVARCARRLAAKMVADQASTLMLTIVGIQNTSEGPSADLKKAIASDDLTVVVVACGKGARRVLAWLEANSTGAIYEAVHET